VGAPLLQHGAVFGDLVLPLLGRDQILGIDILKPDEHATHTRARCLLDEVWNLVTERVDLDREAAVNAFLFPKFVTFLYQGTHWITNCCLLCG